MENFSEMTAAEAFEAIRKERAARTLHDIFREIERAMGQGDHEVTF